VHEADGTLDILPPVRASASSTAPPPDATCARRSATRAEDQAELGRASRQPAADDRWAAGDDRRDAGADRRAAAQDRQQRRDERAKHSS